MKTALAEAGGSRQPTYRFPDYDGDELLAELVLYVAARCRSDPTFGAIKLNKILWWADFISYAVTGRPVTGVAYQKLPRGPAPARLVPVREGLVEAGDAKMIERPGHGHLQLRIVPLREADLNRFTPEALATVDMLIDEMWGQPAFEISEDSHGMAWQGREQGDLIPYEAVFLSNRPMTPNDVRRTHELAKQYDWTRA